MNTLPAVQDFDADLTLEQLKKVMPARQKQNVTQQLVDNLNQMVAEPEHREFFRQNILGYVDVLQDSNTNLKAYIQAVRYVSYKLMGYTNQEAWVKTFPDRYQRLVDAGKAETSYLRSLVCAYNKGKLVNTILEQSMVPTWVLNQDVYQKAINQQALLMVTAKSEKVRSDAAHSLLTTLKQPEATKVQVDIGVKEEDSIGTLRKAVTDLALAQRDAIRLRIKDAQDVAESKIINIEPEYVK